METGPSRMQRREDIRDGLRVRVWEREIQGNRSGETQEDWRDPPN